MATITGTQPFDVLIDRRLPELEREGPAWCGEWRRKALERSRRIGFPTRKDEPWKYSRLNRITSRTFEAQTTGVAVSPEEIEAAAVPGLSGPRLVFVDGLFREDLSRFSTLPEGVTVGSLRACLQSESDLGPRFRHWESLESRHYGPDHVFQSLNSALFEDGLYVHVPRGVVVDLPLELVYLTTGAAAPSASHVRNLWWLEAASQLQVVESWSGRGVGESLTNSLSEFHVAEGAIVDHTKIELESPTADHVATLRVVQDRDSTFRTQFFSFGGAYVRHEVEARLLGSHCTSTMNGVYIGDGERQVDNCTVIHHAEPHCDSHEVYKGVLAGRAHGAFNGKIFVHQDAQKTDAKQSNDSLLLSREAAADTRPNLEIYADDVRCTHGATVGQLNADQLFYMQSRGIARHQARKLLTRAFASEVIDGIEVEAVRERVETLLDRHLPEGEI